MTDNKTEQNLKLLVRTEYKSISFIDWKRIMTKDIEEPKKFSTKAKAIEFALLETGDTCIDRVLCHDWIAWVIFKDNTYLGEDGLYHLYKQFI